MLFFSVSHASDPARTLRSSRASERPLLSQVLVTAGVAVLPLAANADSCSRKDCQVWAPGTRFVSENCSTWCKLRLHDERGLLALSQPVGSYHTLFPAAKFGEFGPRTKHVTLRIVLTVIPSAAERGLNVSVCSCVKKFHSTYYEEPLAGNRQG